MARSTYVYVVLKGIQPVAGFTVRHELATWLRRAQVDGTDDILSVWRLPDGDYGKRVARQIDMQSLLEDA